MAQGYSTLLGFVVIVVLYAAIGFMAAAGAILIAWKFLVSKAEQIFFAMFLIMIAGFYLAFAAYFGAGTAWRLETAAVMGFAALARRRTLALGPHHRISPAWPLGRVHEFQAHGRPNRVGR
jgi:hypothetical protein